MSLISSLRILVVEDDKVNALCTSKLLEKEGCRIKLASNGAEAINILESDYFDIVLMDIQMPGMDGLEVTRRIRKSDTPVSTIPIFALSANADPPASQLCREAGMNAYLAKPFTVSHFEKALHQLRSRQAFGINKIVLG